MTTLDCSEDFFFFFFSFSEFKNKFIPVDFICIFKYTPIKNPFNLFWFAHCDLQRMQNHNYKIIFKNISRNQQAYCVRCL